MKTASLKGLIMAAMLFVSTIAMAQQTELTIEVKGIKEIKGNILIAIKNCEDPQKNILEKIAVTEKELMLTLKNLPGECVQVSAFQDLNENYKLDIDEQGISTEPCFSKDNVKIKEGANKLTLKLIDVKEMMGRGNTF